TQSAEEHAAGEEGEDYHNRVKPHRAPEHQWTDELVDGKAQDQGKNGKANGNPDAALIDGNNGEDGGRENRAQDGDQFQDSGHDGKEHGVGPVEDHADADPGDVRGIGDDDEQAANVAEHDRVRLLGDGTNRWT